MRREDIPLSMGRKRKPGPKRAPRKTGGIVKGTTQVMNHKREEIVRLRDMGHSGNNSSYGSPKKPGVGEPSRSETVPLLSRAASNTMRKLWRGDVLLHTG